MKRYLAYFDMLGFRDFIVNNSRTEQERGIRNILRDFEFAISDDVGVDAPHAFVADLSNHKLQVTHFSDTFLLWTQDDSLESLNEIVKVAYNFNWKNTLYNFPARGSLVLGEFFISNWNEVNQAGGAYNSNSIFGDGLIHAYDQAESTNWSGCVVDQSVVDQIISFGMKPKDYLEAFAQLYDVPKREGKSKKMYAFSLVKGTLDKNAFSNLCKSIEHSFSSYNKRIDSDGVKLKIKNTQDFVESSLA